VLLVRDVLWDRGSADVEGVLSTARVIVMMTVMVMVVVMVVVMVMMMESVELME
jgi:hypothetical protein